MFDKKAYDKGYFEIYYKKKGYCGLCEKKYAICKTAQHENTKKHIKELKLIDEKVRIHIKYLKDWSDLSKYICEEKLDKLLFKKYGYLLIH